MHYIYRNTNNFKNINVVYFLHFKYTMGDFLNMLFIKPRNIITTVKLN